MQKLNKYKRKYKPKSKNQFKVKNNYNKFNHKTQENKNN